MKILILSWYFPPANTIGAVRLGGLAEYLHEAGHDIRVVCADQIPENQTLTSSFPETKVIRTPFKDLTRYIKSPLKFSRVGPENGNDNQRKHRANNEDKGATGFLNFLKSAVQEILSFPDKRNGWIPYGVRAAHDLIRNWRPDLIFASAPHFSALLIAHVVAKKHRIPLVCELRDQWWDDPYYPPTAMKTFLAKRCEARILGNATAITTVSEPWAAAYRERYHKPVAAIYNGYDHANNAAEISNPFDVAKLNILYTGHIYVGYRDPSPLFAAVASDPSLAGSVRLWFYGSDPQYLEALVSRYHLDETVMINSSVPHAEAIALQRKADVLLLMQWNDPRDEGHVPAKLFEYLGSLRPVLLLGLEGGVSDTILRERGAGQLCNSPEAIAVQLRGWLAAKTADGAIADVDPSARAGFSRREQYEKLHNFLENLCAKE